jgi:prepilin-type N-terminal cleavage/methylation domain-containing protein
MSRTNIILKKKIAQTFPKSLADRRSGGFTLIEMMVSVALFAIVVMISMTAILSIVDSTKKAQSLKSVMNNLNFALETMTRSIKTGEIIYFNNPQIFINVTDQNSIPLLYKLEDGAIKRNGIAITAPEVIVDSLMFYPAGSVQPSVVIVVQGTVKLSERVTSKFSIQSTVTQRKPGI